MSLIISTKSEFIPAPAGIHNAVCIDVTPLKGKDTLYGWKKYFRIVWEIDEKMENGKRFIASKQYTPSLHPKSTLSKDLTAWRGKAFTAEELKGFDIDKVIGSPCNIAITHAEKDGAVYSNVTAIVPAKGVKLKPTGDYKRVIDREGYKPDTTESNQHEPAGGTVQESSEDDIVPF